MSTEIEVQEVKESGNSMNIGNRIKQRRLSLGMSVDDLAIEVNKNRATIYRYEKGEIEYV